MNQANSPGFLVNQVDRATIGHVNTEADLALVRYQTVTTFETLLAGRSDIDHRNFLAMDLTCSDKFPRGQPECISRFAMHLIQILQHHCLIV